MELTRKKLVICYSGGMDSLIAYHYARKVERYREEDILLLNFDIGQPYQAKEEKAMKAIGLPYTQVKLTLPSAQAATLENYIIPGRNMVFASIAATYGDKVWVVGTKHENHARMFDKNEAFFSTASTALAQAFGDRTCVRTPFINASKTDLLEYARHQGILNEVAKTISCYHPVYDRCGECGLCFKRAIAFSAAGLPPETFQNDPFLSKVATDYYQKYFEDLDQGCERYGKPRIIEALTESKRHLERCYANEAKRLPSVFQQLLGWAEKERV